jgi:hypothetical protein
MGVLAAATEAAALAPALADARLRDGPAYGEPGVGARRLSTSSLTSRLDETRG